MAHKTGASTSTGTSSNSITASTKRQIQQAVPSNYIKKGPYAVDRALDPNDVVIKRRHGEGSKPLFPREKSYQSKELTNSPEKFGQRRSRRLSSSESRAAEKTPYFRDEKREEERLSRKYGGSNSNNLIKRDHKNSKKHTTILRTRSYSRSRSKSPPKSFSSHLKSSSTASSRKYKHSKQQRSSPERYTPRSPHESDRQRHRSLSIDRRTRRYRRSKSRSRSRSHTNDYHKRARSSDRRDPTTQIITIPVPVDPFGYPAAYVHLQPAWSHQPAWSAAASGPPGYATSYPLPPVMPSFGPSFGPAMYRPFRPPPAAYGMPYDPCLLRPPRFPPRQPRPPRFAPRQPKPNYRPRNY